MIEAIAFLIPFFVFGLYFLIGFFLRGRLYAKEWDQKFDDRYKYLAKNTLLDYNEAELVAKAKTHADAFAGDSSTLVFTWPSAFFKTKEDFLDKYSRNKLRVTIGDLEQENERLTRQIKK